MRRVDVIAVGSWILVTSLLFVSCAEPQRANGEACLVDDQCENHYCRAGICATKPATSDTSNLPPATDAAPDVIDDASTDAVSETGAEAGTDAEPDATTDAEPDATTDAEPDATTDAEPDATTDAEPDATTDAESDATEDAPDDVDEAG